MSTHLALSSAGTACHQAANAALNNAPNEHLYDKTADVDHDDLVHLVACGDTYVVRAVDVEP